MTGYGKGEAALHGRTITVELRSVNNRYFDCNIKLPRIYVFAEDAIKTRVQKSISRGKVDIFVTIGQSETGDVSISLNRGVADGYYAGAVSDAGYLQSAGRHFCLSALKVPGRVSGGEESGRPGDSGPDICTVLDIALADFDAMRTREGGKLEADIRSRAPPLAA